MARRGLIGLALPLVLFTVPAAASADPHAHGSAPVQLVSRTVSIPGGESNKREKVTCPEGFTAVVPSWGVTAGKGSVQPAGHFLNSIDFLLNNAFDSTETTAVIGVVCQRDATKPASQGQGDSHTHEIEQKVESKQLVLPGRGAFSEANVACPMGFTAINGYLDGDRRARSEISKPSADGKGWDFGISNLTNDAETTATAQVQCVADQTGPPERLTKKKNCKKIKDKKRRAKCRKNQRKRKHHTHAIGHDLVEIKTAVPSSPTPQEDGIAHEGDGSCPAGEFPAGIGWDFTGHPFTFLNAFSPEALKRFFDFTIFNRSTDLEAAILAVCLGFRTGRAG
jgi:hypothetical protein